MKFEFPHWLIAACTILGGVATALAQAFNQQPELAPYSPVCVFIAFACGAIAGTTGIVSHSALGPRPTLVVTPDGQEVQTARGAERGFIGFRALLALTLASLAIVGLALAVQACDAFKAVEPAAQTLEQCAADYVEAHLGLDWLDFAVQGALACGSDLVDFVRAIADSKDLSVAQYSAEARATLADPAKMGALKSRFGAAKALRAHLDASSDQ